MPDYDDILIGAGLSGLSLAHALATAPVLRDRRVLLIDGRQGPEARTFAWWSAAPTPFEGLAFRRWSRLRVRGAERSMTLTLPGRSYLAVRAEDLRRHVLDVLAQRPLFTVLRAQVDAVEGAAVQVDGRWIEGGCLYDSRFSVEDAPTDPRALRLRQGFDGAWVETDDAVFEPDVATFMDFEAPQGDGVGFSYVLPETARRALVMTVGMGPSGEPPALQPQLERLCGGRAFRVLDPEGGTTPMWDAPWPRRLGERRLAIGVAGGRIRASTGYAWPRIQRDSAAIVASLERHGHPFALPADPLLCWGPDGVMLQAIADHPGDMAGVFLRLFAAHPPERVLRFLDTGGGWGDLLAIAMSLPKARFLKAALRWALRRGLGYQIGRPP